jgi:hypothetical protein
VRTYKFLKVRKSNNYYYLNNFEPFKVVVPDWVPEDFDQHRVFDEIANAGYLSAIVMVEDDFSYRVDWDNVQSSWLKDPKDFEDLYEYVGILGVPCPKFEHFIQAPNEACEYLSRFSDIKRYKGLEDLVSQDDDYAFEYLKKMCYNPNKFDFSDWTEEEICRSPVWIYFCGKKHGFSEFLYNAMTVFSFSKPDSVWVKKFMNTKKLLPKEIRKKVLSKTDFIKKLLKEPGSSNPYYIKTLCENNGVDVSMSTIRKVIYG